MSGLATRVRVDGSGVALARVGWIAGAILIAGISARMIFFRPAPAGRISFYRLHFERRERPQTRD